MRTFCLYVNVRPPVLARPQRDTRTMIDYNERDRAGSFAEDEHKYAKMLLTKRFVKSKFPYVNGHAVTLDWLRMTGFKEPFLVECPDGLDMKMPPSTLTVDQVADSCGRDKIVETVEVLAQAERQMTLDEWAKYYTQPIEKRKKLFNVISLEIGSTKLAQMIERPKIVRDLDWTNLVWPARSMKPEFPRVQLYCLMSVKDCYTDFHIDFGGSSVFYHILSGEKIFYFVRPTPTNLKKYEKWSNSPDQNKIFFGDEVKECIEVRIQAGSTLFLPTGWIHAVFTPKDSMVIGGNFLHGMNIDGQLDVYEIENKTDVPLKFRFPFFLEMQFYAAKYYLSALKSSHEDSSNSESAILSKFELQGLLRLAKFLTEKVAILKDSSKPNAKIRKLLKRSLPPEIPNIAKMIKKFCELVRTRCREAGIDVSDCHVKKAAVLSDDGSPKVVVLLRRNVIPDDDMDDHVESEVVPGDLKPIRLKLGKRPQEEINSYLDDEFDEGVVSDWNSGESEFENYSSVDDDDEEFFESVLEPKAKNRSAQKSLTQCVDAPPRTEVPRAISQPGIFASVPQNQKVVPAVPETSSMHETKSAIKQSFDSIKMAAPAPKKPANVYDRLSKALLKMRRK
ncbi:JmjC domain-containing histone demethylation protein 1 [Entophlyctis sp. JEL0112]|nr:JmjC domain-containing histone demethylation protein 1 [Entophlyctis sp. JEL0112]